MRHFWRGFRKQADASSSALTGGSGHTGAGKGNLGGHVLDRDYFDGTEEGSGRADKIDTRTSKELIDPDRGPRSYNPFDTGPVLQDASLPIIY